MPLKPIGELSLTRATAPDCACVHGDSGRIVAACGASGALEVLDGAARCSIATVPELPALRELVALPGTDLVAAAPCDEPRVLLLDVLQAVLWGTLPVAGAPSSLAYDFVHGRLLALDAWQGKAALFNVAAGRQTAAGGPLGHASWADYDPVRDCFWLLVADPPRLVALSAEDLAVVTRLPLTAKRFSCLALDSSRGVTYLADGEARLTCCSLADGHELAQLRLPHVPDALRFNPKNGMLYALSLDASELRSYRGPKLWASELLTTPPRVRAFACDFLRQRLYLFSDRKALVLVTA